MKLTDDLKKNVESIEKKLNVGKTFDMLTRIIDVHNTKFYLYYLDGFVKDTNLEYARRDMYNLKEEDFASIKSANELIEKALSSIEASTDNDVDNLITAVLSGQTIMLGPWNEAIVLDFRTYPSRGVDEPNKEKVLRGAHDGFVETIVFNTALIRRRIRDPHLVFEMHSVGSISKTDVAVGYISDKIKPDELKKINDMIESLDIKSLTLGDQSFVESINSKSWVTPFPKIRYTERPDVAAAQLVEGSIIIIIDNTPSILILPTTVFSFLQSVDDYYLPVLTGNYLKLIRMAVLIVNLFLTPIYVLLIDNPSWLMNFSGGFFSFLLPKDSYNIPIFLQFIIGEFAIDGLKLASLNTPDSLGTSLSIIGGLILGDYAVQTGWFTPQTILYMAIVALTSFVQPSVELSYAFKFTRLILLILTGIFGPIGFIVGIIINTIMISATKTITGDSYLYPLIPFDRAKLLKLIFRWKKEVDNK